MDTSTPGVYRRLSRKDATLIKPRTLKPIRSPRHQPSSTTPKVPEAPKEMRLELPENVTRENTSISVISRATTANEDRISLRLLSENSILEERKSIKSMQGFSNVKTATKAKPPSRRNNRNVSLTVRPLNKSSGSNILTSRAMVEFKDAKGVYRRKRGKLIGKKQTPKKIKLHDITTRSMSVKPQRPLSKESMYGFDLVKELKRPNDPVKLKTPVQKNEPTRPQHIEKYETNDGDDNFFMCSNHEEDVMDIDLQSNNLTDSLKLSQISGVKDIKTIVESKKKSGNKTKATKGKTKRKDKYSFVRELERVAKTSFMKSNKENSEMKMQIKAMKEVVIEQRVLTKIVYNYDLKTNLKIRQRKRRNKRTVDLTKMTNFARIPTLINWVEYTDILATPAMAMQKQINEKSDMQPTAIAKQVNGIKPDEIANQKYLT